MFASIVDLEYDRDCFEFGFKLMPLFYDTVSCIVLNFLIAPYHFYIELRVSCQTLKL